MASTDAKPIPLKNSPYRVYFAFLDMNGVLQSPANPTAGISKDGGIYVSTTNAVAQIGTSGTCYVDLTAEEMNADAVFLTFNSGTAGVTTMPILLHPEETGDIRVSVTDIVQAVLQAIASEVSDGFSNRTLQVTFVSPVVEMGNIRLVQGDDYKAADGRGLIWTEAADDWPDLTGASVFLNIGAKNFFRKQMNVLQPTGANKSVGVDLLKTETAKLTSSGYNFDIEAVLANNSVVTLVRGYAEILKDVT